MDVSKTPTGLEGSCACGAVRYQLARKPMFTHCCHCTQCQHLTGSAFVLNTIIENEHIQLLGGKVIKTAGPSEYEKPHDIYRCSNCLTAVWSDYGGRPNYRFVRVGTLDAPSVLQPDAHIFVRSKLDWVIIPKHQNVFDVFYELEDEWSAEMLARRKAALGA